MKSNVTIHEVAKAAGVSSTTVFKAINGKPRISEETREMVLEVANEMGYKANKIAQSLKRKDMKIGVVIERYSSGFNDDIIRGMKDAFGELADNKFYPIFSNFDDSYDDRKVMEDFKNIADKGTDAFILLLTSEIYVPLVNELSKRGIPSLLIAADLKDCERLSVIRHNSVVVGKIGAQLLNWVNKDGYNAIIFGNKESGPHKEVVEGFNQEMETADSKLVGIFESQDDENIAYYLTQKILDEYPHVNGIFVCTAVAHSVCKKIIEKGLSGKVKIISTDTYPEIIKYIEDGTIHASIFQDPYMQGKLAVKMIYRYMVEDIVPKKEIYINPKIVIRSNCKDYN